MSTAQSEKCCYWKHSPGTDLCTVQQSREKNTACFTLVSPQAFWLDKRRRMPADNKIKSKEPNSQQIQFKRESIAIPFFCSPWFDSVVCGSQFLFQRKKTKLNVVLYEFVINICGADSAQRRKIITSESHLEALSHSSRRTIFFKIKKRKKKLTSPASLWHPLLPQHPNTTRRRVGVIKKPLSLAAIRGGNDG